MKASYKKLWKLLIDKDMNKTDLRKMTGLSTVTIARMTHGEYVTLSVLKRICEVLDCDIGDVVELEKISEDGSDNA